MASLLRYPHRLVGPPKFPPKLGWIKENGIEVFWVPYMTLTNCAILDKGLYLPVSTSPSGKIEVIFYEHSGGSENQNWIYTECLQQRWHSTNGRSFSCHLSQLWLLFPPRPWFQCDISPKTKGLGRSLPGEIPDSPTFGASSCCSKIVSCLLSWFISGALVYSSIQHISVILQLTHW